MAGNRACRQFPLNFPPGVYTNAADRDARNRWKSSSNVRWFNGLAEKIGGFARIALTGYNSGVYIGAARALHDWSSLDSAQWIAIGTHIKLHLVNNGRLYDITPIRKTSNVVNPFTTTNASNIVTVVDPDHRAADGDYITINSSSAVGGLTISGDYPITSVLSPTSYTITAASPASSGATGGGATSISYTIGSGLASNGERRGWGAGTYGAGTWGTPRPVGSGVPAKLRIWSLDNWGEDLLASPNDGELYYWQRKLGPNARAQLVPSAPTNIQRMLVNPESRFVIAFGCSDLDSQFDPMVIRWPSQETIDDWFPTDENTAGSIRLDHGSRIITALKTRQHILVWSDTHLYALESLGAPLVFGVPEPLGKCAIVGPNAVGDLGGIAYMMVFDDFLTYDGTLNRLPCEVHTEIFGERSAFRLDKTQAEKVTLSVYEPKGEIRWDYPSVSGGGENDRYVCFSRNSQCWYTGASVRTSYHGVSAAITGYMTNPYGANNGRLYKHEIGTDEVDGATTVMPWHLESYDLNLDNSGDFIRITGFVPVFDNEDDDNPGITGEFNLFLKKKSKPQRPYQTRGPWIVNDTTDSIDAVARGFQVAMRLEAGTAVGQNFRIGNWLAYAIPHGLR